MTIRSIRDPRDSRPVLSAAAAVLLLLSLSTAGCVTISRQEEIRMGREYADSINAHLPMVDAGWHPRGLESFFRTLHEMREDRPNALEALFTSHPLTEDRIQAVRRIVDRIPPERMEGLRETSAAYPEMKAALERLPRPPEKFRVERGEGEGS